MKQFFTVMLACIVHAYSLAAEAPFYVVDIRHSNEALLHMTQEKVEEARTLPLTLLGSSQAGCCFVFGAAKSTTKDTLKVNNDAPLLSSSNGDETYQFLGAYRPAVVAPTVDQLAFGFIGMSSAKLIGQRTYEVALENDPSPIFLRHCLGQEGVNFLLFHSLQDKKPYVRYYFALGYSVKPNCSVLK